MLCNTDRERTGLPHSADVISLLGFMHERQGCVIEDNYPAASSLTLNCFCNQRDIIAIREMEARATELVASSDCSLARGVLGSIKLDRTGELPNNCWRHLQSILDLVGVDPRERDRQEADVARHQSG